MTEPFRAEHAVRSASFDLALPRDQAFELFTPEGEKAWAEGWDPEYLYPVDGQAGMGMVFRTQHGGEETVWTMTRYEPESGAVSYLRCTHGSRIAGVEVLCAAIAPLRTQVTVTYSVTGLSDTGNDWIRAMDRQRYKAFIGEWEAAISRLDSLEAI
jgi:hypothetical protein